MTKHIKNIEGQRFGKLVVLSFTGKRKKGSAVWLVKCDCGKVKEMSKNNLTKSRSCGCMALVALREKIKKNRLNLQGKIFGKLTVISFSRISTIGRKGNTAQKWFCLCECGSTIEVSSNALTTGNTKSCGCSSRLFLSIGQKFGRWTTLSLVPVKDGYKGGTFYICRCDCGKVKKVRSERLKYGRSFSCGCYAKELQKQKAQKNRQDDPNYEQRRIIRRRFLQCLPEARFKRAIDFAKKRKLPWNILEKDYYNLIAQSCHYCNISLVNESGVGLDRINNDKSIGYRIDNVLPCCKTCNMSRGDRHTVEEFKVMMNALLAYKNDLIKINS